MVEGKLFTFCHLHLDELYYLIECDNTEIVEEFSYSLAFCLESLSSKSYKYDYTIY